MKKIPVDKNLLKVTSVSIIIALFYFFSFSNIPSLSFLQLKTADFFKQLTYAIKPKPNEIKDLCVIKIDDESFMALNKKWPWPRSIIAEFLENLNEYKPKIISLDLSFIGESESVDADLRLARAIKNCGNVILSAYITPDGTFNKPFLPLREAALDFGFVNKPRDIDLIVRRVRVILPTEKNQEQFDLSFGLKSVLHYYSNSEKIHLAKIKNNSFLIKNLGNEKTKKLLLSTDNQGTAALNFQAKDKDFISESFYKILNKSADAKLIEGRLIAIGVTAEIFHDVYPTTLGILSGVSLNANEMLMYLSGNFPNKVPDNWQLFLIVIAALWSSILTYKFKVVKGLISLLTQLVILSLLALAASYFNFRYDYFGPIFIACFIYAGTETYKYGHLIIEATILKKLSITDGLTGLYLHRYLILRLDQEFKKAYDENSQLSLLIMDIDHFKRINDTYGHEQGNVVLKNIAKIIQDASRKLDIVARYGGEEFCAILPSTNELGANIYAQRLRKTIEEFNFPYKENQPLKVTISIGIASSKQTLAQNPAELISFADKALYQAKETGRNTVCTFVPPPEKI
jgi:diguanylate cyclase (GGDEF)-like protein